VDKIPELIKDCQEALEHASHQQLEKLLSQIMDAAETAGCSRMNTSAENLLNAVKSKHETNLRSLMDKLNHEFNKAAEIVQFCIENDCLRRR
jgi:hypothetical protein